MEPFKSPSDKARWTELAEARAESQRQAKQERQRLQGLLAAIADREASASADEREVIAAFRDLFESTLRQIQLQDVDNAVWELPDPQTQAQAEWEQLESLAALLRIHAWNMGRVHAVLEADLEGALSGAPAAVDGPPAWTALREHLAGRADWVEALRGFALDYPAFRAEVAAAASTMAALRQTPAGAERVRQAKELNLPAIRGHHFRLDALFRKLDGGEPFLTAFKFQPPPPKAQAKAPTGPIESGTGPIRLAKQMLDKLTQK